MILTPAGVYEVNVVEGGFVALSVAPVDGVEPVVLGEGMDGVWAWPVSVDLVVSDGGR